MLLKTMQTDTCDLCRSSNQEIVAQKGENHCRIALCRCCGLFFASPGLEASELEAFYQEAFTGDAGSNIKSQTGLPVTKKIRSEEKRVKRWALPKVLKQLTPKGLRILDLRARSGALSQALVNLGAEVVSVDPFPANLNYARQIRRLPHTRLVPTTKIHLLNDFEEASFDAITVLTIHLLSHLLSPRVFLQNAWRILKPGGTILLMEKDVLRPNRNPARPTPFSSGIAHQFHLTEQTLALYLQAAGFEVRHCRLDPDLATGQNQVIYAVATKPVQPPAAPANLFYSAKQNIPHFLQQCHRIESFWYWYAFRGHLRHRKNKLLKKIQSA